VIGDLQERAPNFYKWAREVIKHPSVVSIYDEDAVVKKTRERVAKLKAT
jgi:glutathione S-transferase